MAQRMQISGQNLRNQSFPFRPKFMSYLIENSDAKIMQKFHRSCKHLYQMAPYFIVDSLAIARDVFRRFENENYDGCLDFLLKDELDMFFSKIDNIWVTKLLMCEDQSVFKKVVRSEVQRLWIWTTGDIAMERLQLLIKSGNTDFFRCRSILYPDGSVMPLEDILAFIPNATNICIHNCYVTSETMAKIIAIPWKQKIKELRFFQLSEDLDVDLFFKFAQVNLQSNLTQG